MKTKSKVKKKINYGNVDVDLSNLKASEIKIRVTTMLDSDVLDELKSRAHELGMGYQTLLNQHLRETLLKEEGLLMRIEKIEKKVFGKKGA